MNWYRSHIFPRLMEHALSNSEATRLRRRALESVSGNVLEIGFGTGLNLACYPAGISGLTAIDSERMLSQRVTSRIKSAGFPVQLLRLDASKHLPLNDASFDFVVSTWTLCSIQNIEAALAEVSRVLKSRGRFVFLEHGRSDDLTTALWQDRFTPVQKFIACGCHIDRPIDLLIAKAGLKIQTLHRFQMAGVPRIEGEMYLGAASRQPAEKFSTA